MNCPSLNNPIPNLKDCVGGVQQKSTVISHLLHETRDAADVHNLGLALHSNDKVVKHLVIITSVCVGHLVTSDILTSSTLSIGMPVHKATIFLHWYSFPALAPCRDVNRSAINSSIRVCHNFSLLSRIRLETESVIGIGGSVSTLNEISIEPAIPTMVELGPRH